MTSAPDVAPFGIAPDEDELITGEAVALDLRPAGFVLRAAGAIIDWFVYFGAWLLLVFAFSTTIIMTLVPEELVPALLISSMVLCWVAVPTAVETLTQGKSLGKLAVGARIVRDDGGAIGLRHAFIRAMLGVLEIFMTLGGLAATVGLLNTSAKRLGDLAAGTYSQLERVSKKEPPVWGVPVELTEWAKTADVARMPDSLARRVSQFLHQAGELTSATRDRVSRDLANEAARYVSPVPAADPVLFLAAVSAVRREREFAAHLAERERLARLEPVLTGLPHRFPRRD